MITGRIFAKIKRLFAPKAIVLMYHRVAEPESDVWDLAVSAQRFEEHLKVLQKTGNVIPLEQLAHAVKSGSGFKNKIAITFDDGYIDNFEAAKPLLEKYGLPATFFITTGRVESRNEFWWDELERIFLLTANLPSKFSMVIGQQPIDFELKDEAGLNRETHQKNVLWKASSTPPTLRAALFYTVWQQIKPLPFNEQEKYLQLIREWAALPATMRSDCRTMSAIELKQLASTKLFTIGAHTITHPALAGHNADIQKKELGENRTKLREITGQPVNLLAYPYGNYNETTMVTAFETGFYAAFTTEQRNIEPGSGMYSLGRFQMINLTGREFELQLKKWR